MKNLRYLVPVIRHEALELGKVVQLLNDGFGQETAVQLKTLPLGGSAPG